MINKEDIFELCIRHFGTYLYSQKMNNPLYIPMEKDILPAIQQAINLFQLSLSNEDLDVIINKIKARHFIYQEEGSVILGEYEHNYEWYNKLKEEKDFKEFYWDRYKTYLLSKRLGNTVIDTLDKDTTKITSYLGNPRQEDCPFSIRGLVVGDVQSGKTSNYLGLITKAADAGYKVIFILTGTIESLRKQTQIRVEEGFIGYDTTNNEDVGVCRGTKTPKAFTSRAWDVRTTNSQNTSYKINDFPNEPMVFIVKKNVSVLKTIYDSLKSINTTKQYEKINSSLLLIDDEADYASINTNKENNDPTKINEYIRKILALFTRNSYVGYTATPFANVFIRYESENEMLKDDLFPKDFIYSLYSPSNYLGPNKYFEEKNENVRYIEDNDETIFPIVHEKTWDGTKLFPSFYHAINTFLLSNAIRDIREHYNAKTHRSMLINVSRFIKVQVKISSIVNDYFNLIKTNVKLTHKLSYEEYMKNPIVKSLFETFKKEYNEIGTQWDEVFSHLYDSIKDIKIIVVNSKQKTDKLNYEKQKNGLRVIAIGGLALSRGLTLEGLCVSYFYRSTKTFDVLMQMGRWFGYRDEYADLCKIFMLEDSAKDYKHILKSINFLKKDIKQMEEQNKRPTDYGIRVLNESEDLNITAPNKSRYTSQRTERKSYFGDIFETPYLHRNLDIIKSNIDATIKFLSKLNIDEKDNSIKHPYFRNVPKELIIELLKTLHIHEANERFDTKQMIPFLQNNYKELSKFDVLIMGGSSNYNFTYPNLNINIPLICRKYDILENDLIRMSGRNTRIIGSADPKNGLTDEQKKGMGKNLKAQDYLLEGRNPLLMIYFVEPNNSKEPNDNNTLTLEDNIPFLQDLQNRNMKYIIGFAVGFPANSKYHGQNIQYTVNKTVDYFDRNHENTEDLGDDGNE